MPNDRRYHPIDDGSKEEAPPRPYVAGINKLGLAIQAFGKKPLDSVEQDDLVHNIFYNMLRNSYGILKRYDEEEKIPEQSIEAACQLLINFLNEFESNQAGKGSLNYEALEKYAAFLAQFDNAPSKDTFIRPVTIMAISALLAMTVNPLFLLVGIAAAVVGIIREVINAYQGEESQNTASSKVDDLKGELASFKSQASDYPGVLPPISPEGKEADSEDIPLSPLRNP